MTGRRLNVAGDDALSRIQRRGLSALLLSRTVEEAADSIGVGRRTVERWLSDDVFADAYRALARAASATASSALLAAQLDAVETLRAALHEGSPATRVRAARALLDVGIKVREADVDQRLDKIEEEVALWGPVRSVVRPVSSGWSA
jgi:hypothetical protein